MLGLLCMHANREDRCWPSMTLIAAEAGISTRSARRAINSLMEKGLVDRRRRGRGWEFVVNREMVLALGSEDTMSGESEPHRTESPATVANEADDNGHRGRCMEENQGRKTKKGGGDPPPPSFDEFWNSVPAKQRIKRAEVVREWSRLTSDEKRLAVEWTRARVDSGEPSPEARFVLRDQRWRDGAWPGAASSEFRYRLAELEELFGAEPWWSGFQAWAIDDPSRSLNPAVYLKEVSDE